MFQQVLIVVLFLGAAFYVGRLAYRSFQAKDACQSGCAKCGALDLEKIDKELKAKGL
ncbi:MAG: hypothetical protein U5K54_20260 [Cytophagales bacterium]|nr:hypothetical protein [Cytophagales bacterium]